MTFGAYNGMTLSDILANNPKYLDYLAGIVIRSQRLSEAVREMCDKYAPEITRALELED